MGLPKSKDDRIYTWADRETWPDDERWELLDGVAWQMASPSTRHQDVVTEISAVFRTHLRGKPCKSLVAPFDVHLPDSVHQETKTIRTVVQPDVVVYCDPEKLRPGWGRGAPDLTVEVLSPWTSQKDLREKFELYERHGVREYWIVGPFEKSVAVYLRGADGKFGKPRVLEREGLIESVVLPELGLTIETLFENISGD